LVYFSDDIKVTTSVENFESNTVFLSPASYERLNGKKIKTDSSDKLEIIDFSPKHIEIKTTVNNRQLLVYQQNYYKGWKVYVDGEKQELMNSNFAHMAVLVPTGEHNVCFKYTNRSIIYAFFFGACIFLICIIFSIRYYLILHPEKKRRIFLLFG